VLEQGVRRQPGLNSLGLILIAIPAIKPVQAGAAADQLSLWASANFLLPVRDLFATAFATRDFNKLNSCHRYINKKRVSGKTKSSSGTRICKK
jgi:hypothetical protein